MSPVAERPKPPGSAPAWRRRPTEGNPQRAGNPIEGRFLAVGAYRELVVTGYIEGVDKIIMGATRASGHS